MFAHFDFKVIVDSIPLLWTGLQLSFFLLAIGTGGGIVLGTILALMRLSPILPFSVFAASYVDFFRALPFILVIFWFWFVVPLILGRPVGGLYSAVLAFVIFEAAYYCEIIRAGIQSVPRAQIHAGLALGLTPWQTRLYVVLPRAFRNMLPVLLTQAIVLFQDTSLVYVIGLRDFLTTADVVATVSYRPVEMFITAAVVYFVICIAASGLVRTVQRKYAI
jgi:glutamate/aspartate transport system permease protein